MSTPFINPYETKDVVATSLNNLDKQSQSIISYLDGLFSSGIVKDKQIILDDGTVETLKPFQVANNQGAFWDKGTTYYFQPVADRLREISLEIQGRLNPTDISGTLKAGITGLFSKTLDDSRKQISDDGTDEYANDWKYEKWYEDTSHSNNPINNAATLDDFLNAIGTAAFKMVNAAADEVATTEAITNNSGLKVNINLDSIAKLLDDGDNFYNDDNTIDNPNTTVIEGADSNKQPEFYLIGNRKLPVFGAVENAPNPTDSKYSSGTNTGINHPDYKQDLYNYQNKRIDPNSIYWNDGTRDPEEVFYDMVAIAITQRKVEKYDSSAPDYIRSGNFATAEDARKDLKNIAGSYFKDSQAWYDSATPRNLDSNLTPKPPAFLLGKSNNGTINYSNHDGSYGAFKATDPGSLSSLISAATTGATTGINAAEANAIIANWDWNGTLPVPTGISTPLALSIPPTQNELDEAYKNFKNNVDKITKYYTQSYISASLTSTFGKKNAAISTKNFLIHEALNNLDPLKNPYLQEAGDKDVVKFDKLLADTSGYLRNAQDSTNNQMMQLMDLFLENFDISTSRYVEDKRTLIDLFSGKLLETAGENAEVRKSLFQNISSATKDITSQIKNALTRGIPDSAESQFTLDLFNQTAVRKEDYGLSPIPANPLDSSKHFLPSSWANNKDKFLPAMYYYSLANPTPSGDEANNTLNGTNAKNGLPAGFPIMDVRDFDQFFKATKLALTNHIMGYLNTGGAPFIASNNLTSLYNEMGAFLTDSVVLGTYPSWTAAGFTAGSEDDIFGTLDLSPTADKTNFSRAIQLYKSLDKIINDMKERVSSLEQNVPKIPRPQVPTVVPALPAGTLQSSITGYGDKVSPSLVKSFLEMHEDTKGPTVSVDANAESLQRISYLINTFDDYAKFSQNSAFEGIYAGQVFEADKQNFSDLNTKKPEPGPDGSMPEDKSVPKPLMAASSSSVLVTKLGQMLTNKVNDLVQEENNVISITSVDRGGPGVNVGNINMTNTQLSGSQESRTYLNNILRQISSLSAQNLNIDVSAIAASISNQMETAMQTLITRTDVNDDYRMVFIDDKTIDELISLRNTLDKISTPSTPMNALKQLLIDADLDDLKLDTYPVINAGNTNNAPGYCQYTLLTSGQKKLIDDIRDKKFVIDRSTIPPTYTINGGLPILLPSTNLPDAVLNTLGDLATNIRSMLYSSQQEKPPRVISPADTPNLFLVINKLNGAKIDFANLTNGDPVSYNNILNANVYEVGPGPTFTTSTRALDNATDQAIILARKNFLEDLLYEKKIGGVAISSLNKGNSLNPYYDLLKATPYTALDPASRAFPSTLASITGKNVFKTHIGEIDAFITGFKASLADARLETPSRNIDPTSATNNPANDPIVALREKAKFNFTGIESITNSDFWDGITVTDPLNLTDGERGAIKTALINSKVGSQNLEDYTGNDKTDIIDARTKLLEFFLEGKPIGDPAATTLPATTTGLPYPANYTLNDIKEHVRYKDLITPITYPYPSDDSIKTGSTSLLSVAKSEPIELNGTVNNSKADSFTLREVMGCDKDFTGGNIAFRNNAGEYLRADGTIIPTGTNPPYDTTVGFPDSLNDLEFKMRHVTGEFTTANKQLYIRKMQHFNVLFNTLSGGTTKNPKLDTFIAPPQLFGSDTQNLKQYIESLASDITGSTPFQTILTQVTNLTPITDNINALEVSLAGEIRKPKSGPESEIYSTIHLLTQIENQTGSTPPNYNAGIIQLLNKRKIKDDTKAAPIIDLEHRAATAISPKDGLYQYSGYYANKQYLSYDSIKPPTDPRNSVTGRNIAPDTTSFPDEGWNLQALLATKTSISPPFTTLAGAREYLVGLNEVYKDMQESKSPVIKEQLKVFDLWLRNNSFSPISDRALRGKDSLEADINILDHITEGAIAIGGTDPAKINTFLSNSKTKALENKKSLEDLDDIRTAGKGFAQRIDDGLSATKLRDYFQKNIFYPTNTHFPKAGSDDTRVNFNKDYFGRTLDNSNLPVFGVNIFGTDNSTIPATTYTVPTDIATHYASANSTGTLPTGPLVPPPPARIGSNSYKNFGRIIAGAPVLDPPYEKIMNNVNILLTALTAAEGAGRSKEASLYKIMIGNLLGEGTGVPDAALIAAARGENPAPPPPTLILPGDTRLIDTTLTYTNNYPSTNLKTKILDERRSIGDAINPAEYDGVIPIPNTTLANFALSSKADQPTTMRTVGVEGKSIQELAILLYIMQMFEASNWDWEKYINDTSRYEIAAAVE
ncbi:MAG: hypothetical protein ACKO3R_04715 [bacterium]